MIRSICPVNWVTQRKVLTAWCGFAVKISFRFIISPKSCKRFSQCENRPSIISLIDKNRQLTSVFISSLSCQVLLSTKNAEK